MFIAVPNEYSPCELHEVWPCAICNGDAARYDAERMRDVAPADQSVRIAPGVVLSQFPGRCRSCGTDYEVGTPITYSDSRNGWVVKECCG